jgi:uncharacterized membrane-anchored protein
MQRMMTRPLATVLALLAAAAPAVASTKRAHQTKPAAAPPDAPAPEEKPRFHPIAGPKSIDLGHQLALELPATMLFLEKVEAKKMMEEMGNVVGAALLGVVGQEGKSWIVTLNYFEDGYVKDDDAADFKPKELLDDLREGNEQANEVRKQRGFKPLFLDGWTEAPRYQRGPHHLVWGLKVHDDDGESINFYTRVLGRHGYVAINLIDAPDRIEASKKDALAVLQATSFRKGSRYEDFDKKSDKVAEYGLAALVAGGAGAAALKLAKVGLLAKFGGKIIALLIAFKKALVLFFVAIGAGIKRLFARLTGKRETVASAPPPEPPPANLAPPGDLPPTDQPPPG